MQAKLTTLTPPHFFRCSHSTDLRQFRKDCSNILCPDNLKLKLYNLSLKLIYCLFVTIYVSTSALSQSTNGETDDSAAPNFLNLPIVIDDQIVLGPITVNFASLIVLLVYVLLSFIARYLWIIIPSMDQLCATRDIIEAKTKLLTEGDRPQIKMDPKPIDELIQASVKYVPKQRDGVKGRIKAGFAFTGNITAAWRILHEAERHLAVSSTTAAKWSRGQAIVLLAKLQRMPESPVKLRRELQKLVGADEPDSRIIPLVQEARAFIFEAEDNKFAAVADARNKGFFLFLASVISIIPIVLFFSNSVLILFAGAVGGILSRLRKAVGQEAPIFDFGQAWSVIFLSPIVGALSGFFGLMVFEVLNELQISGDLFKPVTLANPTGWNIVLAFIFGWSATLFDTFLERVEGRMKLSPEQKELSQEIETEAGLEERDEALRERNELRKKLDKIVKENEALLAKLPAQDPGAQKV